VCLISGITQHQSLGICSWPKDCIINGNIDVDIGMAGHGWFLVDVLCHYCYGMLAIGKKNIGDGVLLG
jgi:hypothetical protein